MQPRHLGTFSPQQYHHCLSPGGLMADFSKAFLGAAVDFINCSSCKWGCFSPRMSGKTFVLAYQKEPSERKYFFRYYIYISCRILFHRFGRLSLLSCTLCTLIDYYDLRVKKICFFCGWVMCIIHTSLHPENDHFVLKIVGAFSL